MVVHCFVYGTLCVRLLHFSLYFRPCRDHKEMVLRVALVGTQATLPLFRTNMKTVFIVLLKTVRLPG